MSVSETMSDNGRCRLCVREKPNQISVFRRNLSMRIMKLADVVIREDDWLPKTICLDCEIDIEKCFEFIARIQWADKKFRDEANQIEVEESIFIKQEHCQFENFMEEDCDDVQDHCDSKIQDESDKLPAETKDEIGQSAEPFNLVEIIKDEERLDLMEENEERSNNAEAAKDPLSQGEPFLEVQGRDEYAPAIDPLICLKEEAEAVDLAPSTSTKSSSVRESEATKVFPGWPAVAKKTEVKMGMETHLQKRLSYRLPHSPLTNHTVLINDPRLKSISTWSGLTTTSTLNQEIVRIGDSAGNQNSNSSSNTQIISGSIENNSYIQATRTKNQELIISCLGPSSSSSYNVTIVPHFLPGNNITYSYISKTSTSQKSPYKQESKYKSKISSASTIVDGVEGTSNKSAITFNEEEDGEDVKGIRENKSNPFCWTCTVNCDSLELLQEHKSGKGYFCRVCTAEFELHAELEAHIIKHKVYNCKVCDKKFLSKKDIWHHRTSTKSCNLEIKCEMCNKIFSSKKSLSSHKVLCHSDGSEIFDCIICSKSFKSLSSFNHHMKRCHTVYEYVKCRMCSKLLLGPESLKCHIQTTHLETEMTYVCSICQKVFTSKRKCDAHEKTHDDSVNLCELCGKSVTGKNAMKRHMANEHPRAGKFTCKYCNTQFGLESDLKIHKRKTHMKRSISKPAFCEICGKVYKTAEVLKKHKLIHSDERPFKCDICGATFKQQVSLRTHSRIHSSVNKYCCNDCGESFRWKQTFDKHVKNCGNTEDDENMSVE